jgi:4-phosphopantoate--beta-alanine ligase
MNDTPVSHPRYLSLQLRDKIVAGVESGVTSIHGLIAHGRGEAFDYLIGERTNDFAMTAITCAAAHLIQARVPVLSMNGNSTALASEESVELAKELGCPLEINIFHGSKVREEKMREVLLASGAQVVLMPELESTLDYIESNRRYVNSQGILSSDCVFVPLEDGDRCEAMVKMGKNVLVVDLNPLSRTAQMATVSIVDNVVRALPILLSEVRRLKNLKPEQIKDILSSYDNKSVLREAERRVRTIP